MSTTMWYYIVLLLLFIISNIPSFIVFAEKNNANMYSDDESRKSTQFSLGMTTFVISVFLLFLLLVVDWQVFSYVGMSGINAPGGYRPAGYGSSALLSPPSIASATGPYM